MTKELKKECAHRYHGDTLRNLVFFVIITFLAMFFAAHNSLLWYIIAN